VPAGLVKVSADDVLFAIWVPAGTLSPIVFPEQEVSSTTPGTSVVRQAPLAQVFPAATQV
jgi:hypothetical protein